MLVGKMEVVKVGLRVVMWVVAKVEMLVAY